jgi:glucokinase
MSISPSDYIVVDVGGTNLRIGRFEPISGRLLEVRRFPTPNHLTLRGVSIGDIQETVVAEIAARAGELNRDDRAIAMAIAFAGPVNAAGEVVTAPTIWGRSGAPLPLAARVAPRVGLPVHVMNDVTAAAWRFSCDEPEPFCVLTIGSSIGNKVFRNGEVLLGPNGEGGEIGHYRCDPSDDALPCECGGFGHLGGIASGRGIVQLARRLAEQDPRAFAESALAAACCTADRMTSHHIAAAVRSGDRLAFSVLRRSLTFLANSIAAIYTAIGIRRFILMGGFAWAVGNAYVEQLQSELRRIGCFGLIEEDIGRMVRLSPADDDCGLIGAGIHLNRFYADANAPHRQEASCPTTF